MRMPRRRSGVVTRTHDRLDDTFLFATARTGLDVSCRIVVAGIALATISACGQGNTSTIDSAVGAREAPTVALVDPPDSATIASAVEALVRFLDASREGSPTRSSLGELTSCGSGDETPVPGPMLATYALLPAMTRADTVVGRAVVTTVAEQDLDRRHPGYFVARLRIRSDTLEWDVLPSAAGGWVVCNGLAFGLTAADSLTEWRPEGASASRARAMADSMQRVALIGIR